MPCKTCLYLEKNINSMGGNGKLKASNEKINRYVCSVDDLEAVTLCGS